MCLQQLPCLRYSGTAAGPNEVLLRSPNCHRSGSVAELDKGLITRRLQNAQPEHELEMPELETSKLSDACSTFF